MISEPSQSCQSTSQDHRVRDDKWQTCKGKRKVIMIPLDLIFNEFKSQSTPYQPPPSPSPKESPTQIHQDQTYLPYNPPKPAYP